MAKHDRRFKYASDAEKPVMLSVRVPRELYDRLERYAMQYRQSISELVKDGVELRLEMEADPRSRSASSTCGETDLQIDGASILRDMQATLARHDTQMQALMQVIERQAPPAGNDSYDSASYRVIHSNTGIEPEEPMVTEPSADQRDTVLDYDHSKHHLGTLCPRGHDHSGSGHSLRNADNQCLACKAQEKREKRARAKRQAATT
jgi:hypothetical protein